MNRRHFITTTAAATTASTLLADHHGGEKKNPDRKIFFSLKCGMCREGKTLEDKFKILQEIGYDGVELDSPGGQDKTEAKAASEKLNFPIHGVVDSIHWRTRLSDPSEEIRKKGLQGLLTAIKESHQVGGSSVLLVPGVVDKNTTHQQAWDRSLEQIQKALPLAARLGIHIIIENVWNKMFYDPNGDDKQSAAQLAKYIDEANSPWVGSYFDIGNHQRYGKPAEWIRTLGKRIVKLDVKDWGTLTGFSKIGDGDVDWLDVRKAISEIGFTGWATAEVEGGDKARCAAILNSMQKHLLG